MDKLLKALADLLKPKNLIILILLAAFIFFVYKEMIAVSVFTAVAIPVISQAMLDDD